MEFPTPSSPGKGAPKPHDSWPASTRCRRRSGSFPLKTITLQAFQEADGWFLLLCFPKPLVFLHVLHLLSACIARPKMLQSVLWLLIQELWKHTSIFCGVGFGWRDRVSFGRVFVLTSLSSSTCWWPTWTSLLHTAPPPFHITSTASQSSCQGKKNYHNHEVEHFFNSSPQPATHWPRTPQVSWPAVNHEKVNRQLSPWVLLVIYNQKSIQLGFLRWILLLE